jgi:hypothetical protein
MVDPFAAGAVTVPVVINGAQPVRSDILEKARKDLAAVERDHASLVSSAARSVRASKLKLDAAQRRVRDLEFSVVSAEAAIAAEQRRTR